MNIFMNQLFKMILEIRDLFKRQYYLKLSNLNVKILLYSTENDNI